MPRLTTSHRIDAAPTEVFNAFTDFENAVENIPQITALEILTDGPIGKGTRFRETRVMFGKECTETMDITEFDPGEAYSVESESCGAHFKSTFRFRSDGEGTKVDFEMDTQARTFFAKLMSPISGLMMKSIKKCIDADILAVKNRIEAENSVV